MAIRNSTDCLAIANGHVAAAHAMRDDLLAVLFPRRDALPSELLQSQVKVKLRSLTTGIERQLLPFDTDNRRSWEWLSEAGLLREGALVDFALARIAEDRISAHLQAGSVVRPLTQLPVTLLGHANARIAELARSLLHAEQVARDNETFLFQRLDSACLHLLVWRVVAVLQENAMANAEQLTAKAQVLLASAGTVADPVANARKLAFFLGSEYQSQLANPVESGLFLFVANMEREYRLHSDILLRLIAAESVAPLLVLLKAQRLPSDSLPSVVAALRGRESTAAEQDVAPLYASMDAYDARAAIAGWAGEFPA